MKTIAFRHSTLVTRDPPLVTRHASRVTLTLFATLTLLFAGVIGYAQTPASSGTATQSWDAVPASSSNFISVPSNTAPTNRAEALRALRRAMARTNGIVNQTGTAVGPLNATDALSAPPVSLRPALTDPVATNVAPAVAAAAVAAQPINAPATIIPTAAAPAVTAAAPNVQVITPQGGAAGPGAAASAAGASTNTPPEEELIPPGMIDFRGADLNQVLSIYADLKNRTILRPSTLNAAQQIVLQTRGTLTRKEAIQALDTVLALNGISVVDVGDKFCEVLPAAQGGQVGAPIGTDTNAYMRLPDMGQFVQYAIQLTYVKPTELVPVLTPFASPGLQGGILPFDTSQMLVLRDYTPNVKRMLEMIKKIDISVPSEYKSEVIPIKYALASDIASALNSLSSGGGGTTVGSGGGASRGGFGGGSRNASSYNRGGYGGGSSGFGYPGGGLGQSGFTPQAAAPPTTAAGSFTDRLQNIIRRASASGEIQVLGQTKVIADERTNSLLIFATQQDMDMIKKIISQLDVVLAQVLIEAVIIQVSLNDNNQLGVSYLQKSPSHIGNYVTGIGALNNNTLLNSGTFATGTGTNIAGSIPGGFSYLASLGNDLDVSLTALTSSSKAKILQRPRIQTSHAVPATLFVGEQRPYPVSSYYGGGAFGGYASIQQLQIGVSIEVTPLINPDGLVVMDIHTKIDSFEGNVTIQNVGDVPITSSKDATAKVAVRDRDTIMLGGLIETDKSANNSGMPFLKDIPLLGYLFRTSSSQNARTELIVLIRPTVLPTPEVAALAARAEKEKMPGVRETEREIQKEDAKRLRQVDKNFNK